MNSPIIVPDTGIVLAFGYGPDIDSNAPLACETFKILENLGSKPVLLSSVEEELGKKRGQLQVIQIILKVIYNELDVQSRDKPISLLELEKRMSVLRRNQNISRFIEAIENEMLRIHKIAPDGTATQILTELLGSTSDLIEKIRLRIESLGFQKYTCDLDKGLLASLSKNKISLMDRTHLCMCQQLGQEKNTTVVFLVFESPLQGKKETIETLLCNVKITNPKYIGSYLGNSK